MGSEFWRQPAKRLDREIRAMGASRLERSTVGVSYQFPDGAVVLVRDGVTPGRARVLLNSLQNRYGDSPGDPLGFTEKRSGAPTIDLSNTSASTHAKERLALMAGQAGLTYQEVLIALRAPSRVLWSPNHHSWLWVGDRIAVSVIVSADGHASIRTILWTTQELWAQNPRPDVHR